MAFVVRRTSKAGSLSTALVESYRDEQGRPRQRLVANLHGEPTPLQALAKLTVQWEALCEENKELMAEYEQADEKTKARLAEIILINDRQQDRFLKDGAAIEQHCTATPDELQDVIQAHKQEFMDAFHEAVGRGWAFNQQLKAAKAKLRRLST